MKKAISVLMIAACMLCMATACEKKDKKENDTSAAQATETDCTAAELVTTEPEGEITISEMIDQRIKEEGKITLYRMRIAESNSPVEITEDLKVKIISYDGEKLKGYDNPDDFLMELPLRAALLLVLSGAVGNIIDRVCRGYVVDFFEFTFFDWPVFNVADIYVVAGVILMVLLIVFVLKDEDLDLKKKKDE